MTMFSKFLACDNRSVAEPMATRENDKKFHSPSNGEVNLVIYYLLPVAPGFPGRFGVCPDPTIVERGLHIVFDQISIQLDHVGVLEKIKWYLNPVLRKTIEEYWDLLTELIRRAINADNKVSSHRITFAYAPLLLQRDLRLMHICAW